MEQGRPPTPYILQKVAPALLLDRDANRSAIGWSKRGALPFKIVDERQPVSLPKDRIAARTSPAVSQIRVHQDSASCSSSCGSSKMHMWAKSATFASTNKSLRPRRANCCYVHASGLPHRPPCWWPLRSRQSTCGWWCAPDCRPSRHQQERVAHTKKRHRRVMAITVSRRSPR